MRILAIATLVFILNAVLMPLLGVAHEVSHEDYQGKTLIAWSDEQSSNGLFQVPHDDCHDQADFNLGIDSLDHHCHHISVVGMATFVYEHKVILVGTFTPTVPLFSKQSFYTRVEYPPILI